MHRKKAAKRDARPGGGKKASLNKVASPRGGDGGVSGGVAKKPKFLLNMICKNEAHVICEAFDSIVEHIDGWVIVDTGSTDGTQDLIRAYFEGKGIEGELREIPWVTYQNRGDGTSCEFEKARSDACTAAYEWVNASEERRNAGEWYAWVLDADDYVSSVPELGWPEPFEADGYSILMEEGGVQYGRTALMRVACKWQFYGWRHELPFTQRPLRPELGWPTIKGLTHASRRLGDRSKDTQKYRRDALCITEESEVKGYNARRVYYIAQSWWDYAKMLRAANNAADGAVDGAIDKALKFYRLRLKQKGYIGELFDAHMKIYQILRDFKRAPWRDQKEVLLAATKADTARAEAHYELVHQLRLLTDAAAEGKEQGPDPAGFKEAYELGRAGLSRKLKDDFHLGAPWVYDWGLKDEVALCGIYSKNKNCIKHGLRLCNELLESGKLPTHEVARIRRNAWHAAEMLGMDLGPYPEGDGELLDPSDISAYRGDVSASSTSPHISSSSPSPSSSSPPSSPPGNNDAFDWDAFNGVSHGEDDGEGPIEKMASNAVSKTKAEEAFSDVYARSVWTEGSGPGSTLAFNEEAYMPFLSGLIRTLPITRIVDLGCGDWQFSRHLVLPLCSSIHGLRYDGFDCVRELVERNNDTFATDQVHFHHLDLTCPDAIDQIPDADIVLIKDVLQHLPDEDVTRITSQLAARFNIVIITNCMSEGIVPDIPVGDWRKLNVDHYPLSAAHASRLFTYHGKEVAVGGKYRDWFVGANVPRNIFMTWRDFGTMPPLIEKCVKSWSAHEGWEPHTFDDAMCETWFAEHAPRLLQVYDALTQPIQKADFWRLVVLALEGGIYTDVDVECISSPDRLVSQIETLEHGKPWWVAMPQNHPVHDPNHKLDLMNNVIVAKPRAPFLFAALGAISIATASKSSSVGGVLETTGPRFLRRVHEAMEGSAVRVLPWHWINPIPDLCTTEDSEVHTVPHLRAFYEDLLRSHDFRKRLNPFAVHYWWHTYWKEDSIVAKSEDIFSNKPSTPPRNTDIVDRRTKRFEAFLGGRAKTFASAFAHVATKIEPESTAVVVEWGTVRSFVGHGPGVMSADPSLWDAARPHLWDWGAGSFLRVFCEVFDGAGSDNIDFTSVDPDAAAQRIAAVVAADFPFVQLRAEYSGDYMDKWQTESGRQIDLLYMDHGDSGDGCTQLHIEDAKRIVEMGIIAPDGLILIDDMDFPPAKGLLSLPYFLHNGFVVRQWSDKQILLQRGSVPFGVEGPTGEPPAWVTAALPMVLESVEEGVSSPKVTPNKWLVQTFGEETARGITIHNGKTLIASDGSISLCRGCSGDEEEEEEDGAIFVTLEHHEDKKTFQMFCDVEKCRGTASLFRVKARASPRTSPIRGGPRLPSVMVAILARNKAFVLAPYLETILGIEYPKDRLHLWIRTNDNQDDTAAILTEWVRLHGAKYASVTFDASPLSSDTVTDKDGNPPLPNTHEWTQARFKLLGAIRQASLDATLEKNCDFYYVADVDNFVAGEWLREGININLPIVAPLLGCTGNSYYANMHAAVSADGMFAEDPFYHAICDRKIKGIIDVPVVHCTYLVRADVIPELRYDDGTGRYEYAIFSDSARKAGVQQYIDNRRFWGVLTFADGHPNNGGPNLPRCVNPWNISQMHKLPYDVKAHRAFLAL